jgi:hypothetical protein
MVPIYLTEDDNGEFQMKMDTKHAVLNDEISLSISEDDDCENSNKEVSTHHHSIYDEWTRMSPQEISLWIDK